MIRKRKKNYYDLSPEEAKKWKQITIFEALESLGGGLARLWQI